MARFLKALWAQIQDQRDRWVFWTPVPMALGIALYFSLHSEPPLMLGGLVMLLMAPLLPAFYRNRPIFFVVLALFLAAGGFAAIQWRTDTVSAPVLEKKSYAVTIRGKIVEVDPQPKTYRIVLADVSLIEGEYFRGEMPARVRVKLKSADQTIPQAGDIVEIRAGLLPLSPPLLPGAFDFQRHAFFKRLGATGFAYGDLKVIEPRAKDAFFFEKLRKHIREKIAAAIPDRDNAALVTAFMIGEDNGISEKDWDTARLSGIAHLIAISGSHFILIAGFPFFLIRALLAAIPFVALRWPVKKIAAVVAMAVSVFYMLLIGSPVPAQRAVIMTCVVMTAIMLDRNPFTLRLAVFAAFILFLFEPESVMGPSFQMSFAAVVALISFYEASSTWWKKHFRDAGFAKRYSLYLLGCFATTLIASIATAPFALYHFSRVTLLGGLFANMIAVPVSSFITFPLGLFACLMMPLGLEHWPLQVTEKSLDVFMYVAEQVAASPYAGVNVNSFAGWVMGLMAFGGLWICVWRGTVRWLGVVPVMAGFICIALTPRPDILVADSGGLFAVRDASGRLLFSSLRREKFVREQWQIREGRADLPPQSWPETDDAKPQIAADDRLTCQKGLCLYQLHGATTAFVFDEKMGSKACKQADIVFSGLVLESLRGCRKQVQVFDKWRLRDHGAYSIYVQPDGQVTLQNVASLRGVRPWTGKPYQKRETSEK